MDNERIGSKNRLPDSDIPSQKPRKTENFFSRNVKLITFLITVGVFLAVFGPIMMLEAKDYFGQENDGRPQMTAYDLTLLSEQGAINLNRLTKYACEESEPDGQNFVMIQIDIEPCYKLFASASKGTGAVEYCKILNLETNEEIDVLTTDMRVYFGL